MLPVIFPVMLPVMLPARLCEAGRPRQADLDEARRGYALALPAILPARLCEAGRPRRGYARQADIYRPRHMTVSVSCCEAGGLRT